MKRRFAYRPNDDYKQIRIDEDFFKGYACLLKFKNIDNPLVVNNTREDICIKDNNYEWIEVYPDGGKYAITIMFDDNGHLIQWYFDISKEIGIDNGIPYEDDLYLDMSITSKGEKIILDEDELLQAKSDSIITDEDVNSAYQTLKELEEKYFENFEELLKLTDYLKNEFVNKVRK